jgi:AraC-like DNA-binding protein
MTLVFQAGDLARPVPTADPLLYRMMSERVEQIERGQNRDLVGRVRDLLQTMVLLPDLQASIVASRLGMSLRSLNRRLSVEGTSVREIRDEVSAETASQLLANTERTASEVAVMLGYSSPSAFSRAFRRWRGVAPARWRTRRRQPP